MRFKHTVQLSILLAAFVIASSPILAQSKRAMTFDDVMSLRVVSDPRISPDGKQVAFVVTQADMKTNFRNSDVWLVSTDGGEPRPMTVSPRRDDAPHWSPDSRRLAFISDRDGKAQVYVIAIDGGEAQRITDVQTAVQSFEWSPDGKRIAYISPDSIPEAREKEKKDGFDQIVADSEYQYSHISIVDIAQPSKPIKITDGPLHATELAWSPDGNSIAFTARNTPKLGDSYTTEIYAIEASGKQSPSRLTNNARAESDVAWSPDGKVISYLSTSDKYPSIGPSRIHLLPVTTNPSAFNAGSNPRILQAHFDGYIRSYEWLHDGRFICFTADVRASRHIYRLSIDSDDAEPLTDDDGLQGVLSVSENSFPVMRTSAKAQRIALLKEGPSAPADIYVGSFGVVRGYRINLTLQLTNMNPQVSGLMMGRIETINWKSKDGREIEGILVYPLDYQAGKRYPLITSIHGGPEGAYQLSFMASYGEVPHIYAARGYASFFPNFRGSSNYGAEFASANVGDLGGGDYQDIMTGVDYLIERGIADHARLAIKGYSYGGYMAGWIIGHTDRFSAAVFGAGLSNAISYYSQGDIQYQRETLHQGTPWHNNQNMIERSPVFYLQNAKTPSLIYQGEKDGRVPLPQSLETYMGLKKAGVPTQLVIYPREGHGLREPKHQLDKMRREMEWIEKYIQGATDKAAAR